MVLASMLLAVLVAAPPAAAHRPSDAYLTLRVDDRTIHGQWDIALRDLDFAIGLDTNDDGRITWGELDTRREAIGAYALARLDLDADAAPCARHATDLMVDRHGEDAYAVVYFVAACAAAPTELRVSYRLFFDLDPQHRGLARVDSAGIIATSVLSPDQPTWRVEVGARQPWQTALTYLREGVRHILTGFDHLLFLISLLLPAVLRPTPRGWRPIDRPGEAAGEVLRVVTAFTVAHSITLGLATLGWISVPPRVVEPLIAASIVLAAVNNIYPLVTQGLWAVAFAFGLVHGIGFADALKDLGLPGGALLLPLFSFNLGVEVGQLLVVAVVLPLALLLRRSGLYQTLGLRFGSLCIAAVAALWMIERACGVVLVL